MRLLQKFHIALTLLTKLDFNKKNFVYFSLMFVVIVVCDERKRHAGNRTDA
jgi:hypothetical protein